MKRYVFVYILVVSQLALVFCFISIVSACDPEQPPQQPPTPTEQLQNGRGDGPTVEKQPPQSQTAVEQAERRWQQQGIASYRIEVLVIRSIWHAQSYQITVQDGVVVDQSASCIPAPIEAGKCKVEPFQADAYTVPGLFAKASSLFQDDSAKTWGKISFDPTYGFPNLISFNNPNAMDDDWSWRVTSFEVLR